MEFGYELLSAVPYAYELFLQGKLTGTISGKHSEPLYFFSPNHKINHEKRSWYNTKKAVSSGLPYVRIHKNYLQPKVFPPYKIIYNRDRYIWEKPTLVIANRANIEWEDRIINYFDESILEWLFKNLKKKYTIVYLPISIPSDIQDNAVPELLFDEIKLCKKHGVKYFPDIIKKGYNWNDALLRVFAGCERFITMNGGYSILASYFSGQNIIYSRPTDGKRQETKELKVNSFFRWYPNINNVQTLHVPDYNVLKDKVKALYIDELPTANVIIRTSKRPNFFTNCIRSVLQQDYPNINIVVTCDERLGKLYTMPYPCRVIEVEKLPVTQKKPDNTSYGSPFPFNRYIAEAQARVNGFIFFLDDDDVYLRKDSISTVMRYAKKDKLVIWRTQFPNRVIPSDESFGKKPVVNDLPGIGLCYHSSQIKKTDWTPWKRADYRTAARWKKDEIIWINEILTGLQSIPGAGKQIDLDMSNEEQQVLKLDRKKDVKVLWIGKPYQSFQPGQIYYVPWIIAVNYIHRKFCKLAETEKEKEPEKEKVVEREVKPMGTSDMEKKKTTTRRRKKTVKDDNQ